MSPEVKRGLILGVMIVAVAALIGWFQAGPPAQPPENPKSVALRFAPAKVTPQLMQQFSLTINGQAFGSVVHEVKLDEPVQLAGVAKPASRQSPDGNFYDTDYWVGFCDETKSKGKWECSPQSRWIIRPVGEGGRFKNTVKATAKHLPPGMYDMRVCVSLRDLEAGQHVGGCIAAGGKLKVTAK